MLQKIKFQNNIYNVSLKENKKKKKKKKKEKKKNEVSR